MSNKNLQTNQSNRNQSERNHSQRNHSQRIISHTASSRTIVVKIFLIAFFFVAVIFPLVRMLSFLAQTNVHGVVSSTQFKNALVNSLVATTISTVISVVVASVLAFCISRTQIKCKPMFTVLVTLPMLIPSVSHGMGLILLFGTNGTLTNLFHLKSSIYGFGGLIVGSVIYSFPIAFLMMADILNYENYVPYEACRVFGLSPFSRFKAVTFPYLRRPMISVFFATFAMIATDYGVPLMVGGKYVTLPVLMYQEVVGLLDFGKGAVIGTALLVPAIVAFLLDVLNKDKASSSFSAKKFPQKVSHVKLILSYVFVCAVAICVLILIVPFIVLSFVAKYPVDLSLSMAHVSRVWTSGGLSYLRNSLLMSVFTAVSGTVVAFASAYFTSRTKGKISRFMHLISITTLAIPGMVLGLSYMLFFRSTFLYGTFAILILVNAMHFFSSPYLMAYNSFSKLNPHLEAVGLSLGVSRWQIVRDVFVPQMRGTITEMFSYFFVNAMMTISAVSFLSTAANKPISLMINMFQAYMILEGAAFVSLLILCVNIAMKGLVYILKRRVGNAY